MLIGILADSHNQIERLDAALEMLDSLGARVIFHCGDVGSIEAFEALTAYECYVVLGNTDRLASPVRKKLAETSVTLLEPGDPVEINGKQIALAHGHLRSKMEKYIASQELDYLLHGHSHKTRDERFGRTRVICPGALERATLKTVATLDVRRDRLQFHFLQKW